MFDLDTVIKKLKTEKPERGSTLIEKKLFEHAAKFNELIEEGYSEEQIYKSFPVLELEEMGMDKKTFIKKLKLVLTKYKKGLLVIETPKQDDKNDTISEEESTSFV